MVQEQKAKQKAARPEVEETEAQDVQNAELAEKTQDTLDAIEDVLDAQLDDEILAELDDVLEENAEQFVMNYVQQGGQ